MSAYQTGKFSLEELQASFLYSKLGSNGKLEIDPGKGGAFVFWASAFFILFTSIYAGVLVLSLLSLKSPVAVVLAMATLVVYFFFAWYIGRDIRQVLLAKSASKKLSLV
jgi:hypothetical protein